MSMGIPKWPSMDMLWAFVAEWGHIVPQSGDALNALLLIVTAP